MAERAVYARRSAPVHAVLACVVAVGLVVVVLRERLPAVIGVDALKIQGIAQERVRFDDKSFMVVGGVYRALGLADHALAAGLLGFLAYVVVQALLFRNDDLDRLDAVTLALLSAAMLLGAVYLGQYSKDVFLLGVTLIVGRGRNTPVREAATVLALLTYAQFARTYWFLVAALYVGLRMLLARRTRPMRLVCLLPVVYLALALLFVGVLGQDLTYARSHVNALREGTVYEAGSAINDLLPLTGVLGGAGNGLLIALTLMVPWPLVAAGPTYLLLALVLGAIWIGFLKEGRRYLVARRSGRPADGVVERSIALAGAVLIVQSLFEPDYGSYLRHLTPVLPLMVLVVLRTRAGSTEGEGVVGHGAAKAGPVV